MIMVEDQLIDVLQPADKKSGKRGKDNCRPTANDDGAENKRIGLHTRYTQTWQQLKPVGLRLYIGFENTEHYSYGENS